MIGWHANRPTFPTPRNKGHHSVISKFVLLENEVSPTGLCDDLFQLSNCSVWLHFHGANLAAQQFHVDHHGHYGQTRSDASKKELLPESLIGLTQFLSKQHFAISDWTMFMFFGTKRTSFNIQQKLPVCWSVWAYKSKRPSQKQRTQSCMFRENTTTSMFMGIVGPRYSDFPHCFFEPLKRPATPCWGPMPAQAAASS